MVPAFFIVLKILGKEIRPVSESLVKKQADSIAIASENLNIITLVKAFSREKIESNRFKENAHEVQKLRKKQLKIQAILSPAIQLLVSTGVVIVVVVSAMHYQSGELTIPALITLLMYGMLFARPMSTLANLYGQTQQALGATSRLNKVFSLSQEPNDEAAQEGLITNNNRDISFKDVAFRYNEDQPLLQNINLEIKANQTIVIIGANGLGKSTLLHLLVRFIQPSSGQITIGGVDINNIKLLELRNHIGLVSQDIALSNGTVADNIAFGYPQASMKEIEQVAKQAGAHQFISELENGYQTQVGENGVLLSGGQRQRISFARALMTEPAILLLDEPTSMIDKKARESFKQSFKEVLQNKTVIMVSHEPSMANVADQVFTIENGQLIAVPNVKEDITQ